MNGLVNPPEGPPVHRARFRVTIELLRQMFHMPEGIRIVGADLEPDGRTVSLMLEDPRIQGTEEGYELPTIDPVYSSYTPTDDRDGPRRATLIQGAWPFEHGTEITGDTFPDEDEDLPEKDHEHVWPAARFGEACEICGYPLTHALLDESPRISGPDPHGKDA